MIASLFFPFVTKIASVLGPCPKNYCNNIWFIPIIFLGSPRCIDDTKWFNGLTEFECDYKCRENACYCPIGWQKQNPGQVIVPGREAFNAVTDVPSLEEPFGWPARINVVGTGRLIIYIKIFMNVTW